MDRPKGRFDVIGQLTSLRRYARSLTRDPADAEDLVHDALLRAFERKHTFRPDGNLRSWLLSILHNVFVDDRRSRRSEKARIEAAEQVAVTFSEPPQEHAVRLAQVHKAFFDLPEEQRAALHLIAIDGLSYQDAANALRIPIGTLMSRIGRARATLRELEASAPPGSKSHLKLVGGRDE